MLITAKPEGPYPYAGIPWFSTVFGRDAHHHRAQTLWLDPAIARGRARASSPPTRPRESTPRADAEPGKILHEMRHGEMARTRRGAVRALLRQRSTPRRSSSCWPARYLERTGDLDTAARALAARSRRALDWIDAYGDRDGDGFVEYAPADRAGAWPTRAGRTATTRSSTPTARLAQGPIALVEVQGYAYGA